MDDPLATVAGPPPKDWIGAQIGPWRTPSGQHGVEVTTIGERILKIPGVIEQFLSQGAKVDKKGLFEASLASSRVSDLCPQVNTFTATVLRSRSLRKRS